MLYKFKCWSAAAIRGSYRDPPRRQTISEMRGIRLQNIFRLLGESSDGAFEEETNTEESIGTLYQFDTYTVKFLF